MTPDILKSISEIRERKRKNKTKGGYNRQKWLKLETIFSDNNVCDASNDFES